MNLVGNVVNYRAGASWMLVVNGRIIRQSELIEGPEPMGDGSARATTSRSHRRDVELVIALHEAR